MNLISLIQGGDKLQKLERLGSIGEHIKRIIKTDTVQSVHMTPSEIEIVSYFCRGLGIPFKDAGENGVLFCSDYDKLQAYYDRI